MGRRITFKTETYLNDEPAGPVVVWDEERIAADPVMKDHKGPGRP